MKKQLAQNEFFDINKFPKGYGIVVFPISIARIENKTGQDPDQCLEYIQSFAPSKISEPKIGVNIIYGDFLYLHSKEEAAVLKQKFMNVVLNHRNALKKLLAKETQRFQIQHGFSYEVWNQLYLNYERNFNSDFLALKNIYKEDLVFQKYIQDDAKFCNRELTEEQLDFFLEENLMFYALSKKKIVLPNEYVQGREEWVLWCYPGKPLKAQIYLYQKNFFHWSALENTYENHIYDLESKKLIDCMRIDLDTYEYTYGN